jgi:LmbE family N-acetylglucosaminyl deacetylase
MAVLAHPDDESLGLGGTLARYASEGVEVSLVTATRGDAGRYRGHRSGTDGHPGRAAMAAMREAELRAAAATLGVRELRMLGYGDQQLDQAPPREVIGRLATLIRQLRPDVVVTFGPDGAYGHPDHIAVSQFATAAAIAAADASWPAGRGSVDPPHSVSKLYYLVLSEPMCAAYQAAIGSLSTTVAGVERHALPWPDWAISAVVDTRAWWPTVWRAVTCHESQVSAYGRLAELSADEHAALWGHQSFYRVFSVANGGSARETDLFEGIRMPAATLSGERA